MVDLLLRAASDAVVSVYGSIAYPVSRYVISQWRNVPGGTGLNDRRASAWMQSAARREHLQRREAARLIRLRAPQRQPEAGLPPAA